MYVRDLEPECLLKPEPGYYWQVNPVERAASVCGKASEELRSAGIFHHGSLSYNFALKHLKKPDIGVYIGTHQLNNYYYGVKKQHIVMVGTTLFAIDGYNFSHSQKV